MHNYLTILTSKFKPPFAYIVSHLRSLYKIQESHLIIPATSAGTERAFSTAGLILNDRRNRLTDVIFEQMLVAKLNGDLI